MPAPDRQLSPRGGLLAWLPLLAVLAWLPGCGASSAAPGGGGGSLPTVAPSSVDAVTVPALPAWTDKYAETNEGDMRFFVVGELMERYGLDRAAAVELQNHYRDLTRRQPELAPGAAFDQALRWARDGVFERSDRAALDAAEFVVVFDLDATLYDQYPREGARCADLIFPRADGDEAKILLTPGWDEAFARIRDAGGAIAIFSANLDDRVEDNLRHWRFEDTPLWEHDAIEAILTNSHLVLQTKHEGRGRENPRKGRPVVVPSKDLRIFDADLEKVILVDDNPTRVVQHDRMRLVKKFDGDAYCDGDEATRAAFGAMLLTVAREIEESAGYARANGVSFAAAYLPYTMLGRPSLDVLVEGGLTPEGAVEYLRKHPELVDRKF